MGAERCSFEPWTKSPIPSTTSAATAGARAVISFARDGLGFSLSETTVDAGREMNLWYKHHQEACFVIEGAAELMERDTGTVHRIGPGDAYAPGHDRHTVRVL